MRKRRKHQREAWLKCRQKLGLAIRSALASYNRSLLLNPRCKNWQVIPISAIPSLFVGKRPRAGRSDQTQLLAKLSLPLFSLSLLESIRACCIKAPETFHGVSPHYAKGLCMAITQTSLLSLSALWLSLALTAELLWNCATPLSVSQRIYFAKGRIRVLRVASDIPCHSHSDLSLLIITTTQPRQLFKGIGLTISLLSLLSSVHDVIIVAMMPFLTISHSSLPNKHTKTHRTLGTRESRTKRVHTPTDQPTWSHHYYYHHTSPLATAVPSGKTNRHTPHTHPLMSFNSFLSFLKSHTTMDHDSFAQILQRVQDATTIEVPPALRFRHTHTHTHFLTFN